MLGHKKPRGHSNVYPEETELATYKERGKVIVIEGVATIPMSGGSTVYSCKPLPPLALRRDEWETIGRKMGWIN